uniref:Uncharacterized protein n=1 Tax=Kalanchoe fedtschenkoi TaxID=63787 RepID=A0A7N0V9Q0_KALFE
MNARPASAAIPPEENSDTDSNPDDEMPEYYLPISGFEEEDDADAEIGFVQVSADGEQVSYSLQNGYAEEAVRGISSIHINGGDRSEEEEEVSDSEILRAFSEDESRRSAPLPAETAMRVIEAMRGVSFAGVAPDWANQVPEDQWIHQLRRIRESSSA